MRSLRAFFARLADPLRRRQRERDLADEIESHLALHVDDGVRAGLDPIEARRQALLKLGGIDPVKEAYRDRRGFPTLDHFAQDVRFALRMLRRTPSFTVVATLTLALGIGVNTAMFQLLDAVRLRALPVDAPEQLAEIRLVNMETVRGNVSIWHAGVTNPIWEEIRARQEAFAGVFAWSSGRMTLSTGAEDPRFASVLLVGGDFFDVLGVRPLFGRLLTADDDQPRCSTPGVVLSHAFWQTEFGGDSSVVGKVLSLGQSPYRIVGVAPREFTGLEVGARFDVVVPLCAEWLPPGSPSRLDSGVDWWLIVMGRLKPGWTLDQARAHLASISPAVFDRSLPPNYPAENIAQYRAYQLTAHQAATGVSSVREQYSQALWFLQAIAALVLLVGCANLANLMLARFTSRERDVALRVALGAGRGRLVRMLLAEALLLSIAGAAAGAALAGVVSRFLVRTIGGESQWLFLDMPVDLRFLAFTAATAVITCALCGIVPAWRTSRVAPDAILRAGGRGPTGRGGPFGVRQLLVVSQVALSLVLLAGAFLFARSLGNLMTQDLGMRPDGVTIAFVNMSRMNLPVERRAAFRRDLIRELLSTPGVAAAAETSVVPLSGSASDNEVWVGDAASARRAVSYFMSTSAGYFNTMAVPIVAGRSFDDDRDTPQSPPVALVNEAFVQEFSGGANILGQRLWREATADSPVTAYEIVGVVQNAKYLNLRQELKPIVYLSLSQNPRPGNFAQMLIRTSMPSAAAVPTLKAALKKASPEIVPTFLDFSEMLDASLVRDQVVAALSATFGALATLLTTLGLYGVISFAVSQRAKEIGIRMALGADDRGIVRMILGEASLLVAAGCIAGAALVLALGRTISSLVYGLAPNDAGTLLAAVGLLAAIALVASSAPARRAARLDPVVTLRFD